MFADLLYQAFSQASDIKVFSQASVIINFSQTSDIQVFSQASAICLYILAEEGVWWALFKVCGLMAVTIDMQI